MLMRAPPGMRGVCSTFCEAYLPRRSAGVCLLSVQVCDFALVCCYKSHACHFPCSILPARQVASISMHVLYRAWMLLHVLGSACSVLLVCGMLPDAAWVWQICCSRLPSVAKHFLPCFVHIFGCMDWLQAMLHNLLRSIPNMLKEMWQCRLLAMPRRSSRGRSPRLESSH